MRKLAKVVKIDDVTAIPDADKIVVYHVGGWTVVGQRNEYQTGDLAIMVEIDAWVPHELAPFLSKGKEPRVYQGIPGERLRTVRLKKQLSQGLLLPISIFEEKMRRLIIETNNLDEYVSIDIEYPPLDSDVSELLGIIKWEMEIPAQLVGIMRGSFPSQIPKTDQERIQNLGKQFEFWQLQEYTWEVTEKLEGSSMTVYLIDGEFGVCSRNVDLKETQDNTFWNIARKLDLENILRAAFHENVAIQGELIGPNIQGNIYGLSEPQFYLFDVYLIDKNRYMTPKERTKFHLTTGIPHVPQLGSTILEGVSISDILNSADGLSRLGIKPKREGLVFKCNHTEASFKAISNQYLEGQK